MSKSKKPPVRLKPNGKLEARLMKLLRRQLDAGGSDLETLPNGNVCGHVVSKRFEGCDYAERRSMIREVINESRRNGELSAADITKISTLLTYTPGEWQLATQDLA